MNLARIKMPNVFKGKSKKEIKELIETNVFNEQLKNIAMSYYIYKMCMIDIAMIYGVDRKTISRKLNESIEEIEMG